MKSKILYLIACLALLNSCFKDVSYKTTYILRPQQQLSSGDAVTPIEGAIGYSFAADTANWMVASYADALAGIITSKSNPANKISTPIATTQPYQKEGTVGWISMTISSPKQMVVVVDPVNELYACTDQMLGINLPELYVSLPFRVWKTGKSYVDGKWLFFNDRYTPPVFVDLFINATAQATADAPPETIPDVKAYAFVADTTNWYIASYDDAAKNTITSKTNPLHTRTSPEFLGYAVPETTSYRISVSSSELMVVIVDRTNKRYAYRRQDVDLTSPPVTVPLLFELWSTNYIDLQDGWRVVNDAQKPATPAPKSRL